MSLQQTRVAVGARIFDLAWSPGSADQLVSGSDDLQAVELWSTRGAGRPQCKLKFALPSARPVKASSARKPSWIEAGHNHDDTTPACMRCAWHPDGEVFLTGSDDGQVAVWGTQGGPFRASFSASESTDEEYSEVYGLAVTSRESLLAVACSDTVQQWDLPNCRQTQQRQFEAHRDGISFGGVRNPGRLAYVFYLASRGRVLAVTLSDGTCRLLDAQTYHEHAVLDAPSNLPRPSTSVPLPHGLRRASH